MLVRPAAQETSESEDAELASGLRPAFELAKELPRRAPGSVLLDGKYRLESPLAVGGMSTIWLATHVTLARHVAVKFIDLESTDRALTTERFLREARLAASIHHPNVIDVLDFGIAENGEPVMVMELLEGEPLSLRIAAEPALNVHEVVHVMSQVLGALEAVHRAGILHCDMKPANVMLGPIPGGETASETDLFAWLIDFGIAYSIDPRSDLRRGRFGTDLRMVNGTPEYMAPEQAEGRKDLDERVDVYATSVMLYELFAGMCPFTDEHPGRVLFKVIEGTHVPLIELRPDIPELAAVVAAGMSHDRRDRPRTARELRVLLLDAAKRDTAASADAITVPPSAVAARAEATTLVRVPREPEERTDATATPARRGRRWLLGGAYVLGLIVIGGVLYGTSGGPGAAQIAAGSPDPRRSFPQRTHFPTTRTVETVDPLPPPETAAVEPAIPALPIEDAQPIADAEAIDESQAMEGPREELEAPREEIVVEVPQHTTHSRRAARAAVDAVQVPAPVAPVEETPAPESPRSTIEFVEDPGF